MESSGKFRWQALTRGKVMEWSPPRKITGVSRCSSSSAPDSIAAKSSLGVGPSCRSPASKEIFRCAEVDAHLAIEIAGLAEQCLTDLGRSLGGAAQVRRVGVEGNAENGD